MTSELEILLPCPFCGGPPLLGPENPEDEYTHYRVICRDCKVSTRLDYDESVVKCWNRREERT